jgi:hypothetical protein
MFTVFFYGILFISLLSTSHVHSETITLVPFIVKDAPGVIKKDSQPQSEETQKKDSDLNQSLSVSKEEERYAEIHDTESSLKYFFETSHETCAGRICFALIPVPIPIPGVYYQSRDTRVQILLLTTGADKLLMFRYRF